MNDLAALARPVQTHGSGVRYLLLAVIAGASNLAVQQLTVCALPVLIFFLVGAGVRFLVGYALDKNWIFFDSCETHNKKIRKITLNSVSGIATPAVFGGRA
jgi:hypothetical protein